VIDTHLRRPGDRGPCADRRVTSLAIPVGCACAHTPLTRCGPTCAWEPVEIQRKHGRSDPEVHAEPVSSAGDRALRTMQGTMKNVAIKVIDRLFLVAYGTAGPTDDEWDAYLDMVKRHGIERTMQIIYTDGGEPSAPQRRALNELLGGYPVAVAVVSSSVRVRGTVTALSWFNRKIRAFPPSGLRDAIAYLEIPASRVELIERELLKLRLEVRQP
jgi:hypothetical protein